MAIKRIFDVDSTTKTVTNDDIVGRFRSGQQLNDRPLALSEWRITSADPEALATIAKIMGGDEPTQWDTKTDEKYELFTKSSSVNITLDGPTALRSSMVLWGRSAKIRQCNGAEQEDGTPCACPSDIKELKVQGKQGLACEPSIQVYFRLTDAPELGKFKFFSGSWTMAKEMTTAEEALEAIDGAAYATMHLELVEYTTKDGKNVKFTKPVVTILGPAEDTEPF
jgi:hypothetical protein